MKILSSIFGGGPSNKPQEDAIKAQAAEVAKQKKDAMELQRQQQKELSARAKAKGAGRSGRALLMSNSSLGFGQSGTLGGGA